MRAADLVTLYDYYYWATGKILEQAAKLTPEQWSGPAPIGDRSLQAILVHALSAERGWRHGWEGKGRPPSLQPTDFPTVAALADRWREEEAAMRAYLAGLSDEALTERFAGWLLWHTVVHVAHHGMQHRSEAALILTHHGYSPGDLDLVFGLAALGMLEG